MLRMFTRIFWKRAALICGTSYLLFSLVAGVALAELQLRLHRRPLHYRDYIAAQLESKYQGTMQDAEITAADGVKLKGWYLRPAHDNGKDVVMLHGITDNREGMAGFAPMLLDRGYRILLVDARAHGESGGSVATYGLLDADDIHRWVGWLYQEQRSSCVYGFGESMGAALVLESLSIEPRFCAVVAESAFSTFRSVAYDRVAYYVHLGPWFGKTVGRLPIEVGLLYTKLRYGLDLSKANPAQALAGSITPVLLIHGSADTNILPHHSELMAARFPNHVSLWEVNGALHTGAAATEPEHFREKLVQWFAMHPALEDDGSHPPKT
jgi:uncharacterized protein